MKRTILLLTFAAITSFLAAQTIVSTTPENRDAVLEEFTGRNCGFCPEGHQIAEDLKTQHGDDFWVINIHAGGFSPSSYPNLNSSHSQLINSHFSVTGYPSGAVNRHDWGQGVVLGRGSWEQATNSALADPAYCNVGVEASIDQVTRIVTVDVEVYYTDNSPVSTNYLNIAILGNGVIGSQSGGGANYEHNHFLIEMINNNGPWGDEITTTSQGDLHTATYTWTLPETLPVENGPDLDATTLEVVAFVTQDDKDDVINADGGDVASNPLFTNDVAIINILTDDRTCDNTITPSIILKNGGTEALTACEIEYSVNGETPATYSWTGNLGTLESEEIELAEIEFTLEAENELLVEAIITGDGNLNNNSYEKIVYEAPLTTKQVVLHIEDGLHVTKLSWELKDSQGNVVQYNDNLMGPENVVLNLNDFECYTVHLYHEYGTGFVSGYMSLTDANGQELGYVDGLFGAEAVVRFQTGDVAVNEMEAKVINSLNVFPNPTDGEFNIAFNLQQRSEVEVVVTDITGRIVYTESLGVLGTGEQNISSKNMNLVNGVYFVAIQTENSKVHQKFQVIK